MTPSADRYQNRRLWLMLGLLIVGFLVGLVWGYETGYERGKADTMKVIEKKLEHQHPDRLPT